MKKGTASTAVYRTDYAPYPWKLGHLNLWFDIGQDSTRVRSEMSLERNPCATANNDIELDGQKMELISVLLDGRELQPGGFSQDADKLIIHNAPDACTLNIEVLIKPQENTSLEGMYPSGGFLLTQCESEVPENHLFPGPA